MEFCRNSLERLGNIMVVLAAGSISAGIYPSIKQYIPEKMKYVSFGVLIGMLLTIFYKMEKDIGKRSKDKTNENETRLKVTSRVKKILLSAFENQMAEIREETENLLKEISNAVSRDGAESPLFDLAEITLVGESIDDLSKDGRLTDFQRLVIQSNLQTDLLRLNASALAFMLKDFDLNCEEFVNFVEDTRKAKNVPGSASSFSLKTGDLQKISPETKRDQYKRKVENLLVNVKTYVTEVSSPDQIAEASDSCNESNASSSNEKFYDIKEMNP